MWWQHSRDEEGKPHKMKYEAIEETTPAFTQYVPLEENHPGCCELLKRTCGTQTCGHAKWTQRQAEIPKCCVRVPKGGQAKQAALRRSTLCYFKHYDFIVVCSEAAQMGCLNFCYYRKIRRPRLEAVFLSPPVRASWSGNCDVLSSCKHCFFLFSKPKSISPTLPCSMEPNARATGKMAEGTWLVSG